MGYKGGFQSEEHEAAFRQGNLLVRRGGPAMAVCGARTRTGAACQQPPLREGAGRCIRHAGPHAARAHRATQLRELASGKLTAEEWNRAEARRAANRLGDLWKKNPWVPGSTIDLGPAEAALRHDLARRAVDVDALAPAVADWLRWRYRRTQIDRTNGAAWHVVQRDQLPERIAKAGPRPVAEPAEEPRRDSQGRRIMTGPKGGCWPLMRVARTWTVDVDAQGHAPFPSRRRAADAPRAPKVIRGKGFSGRGRPRVAPPDEAEAASLMAIYRDNMAVLAPLLEGCPTEAGRTALLRALRDFLTDPGDGGKRQRWLDMERAARAA